MKINKKALSIRKSSNFSHQNAKHKFDKSNFDLKDFSKNLDIVSPKVIKLLETIKELDNADMKNHKKQFKHVIYTDIKDSSAGSKMLASSLLTNGYKNIYDKNLKLNNEILSKNSYKNFALLCSVQIYSKPFPVKLKKEILNIFNQRPDNINGKNIRFIILDPGFKEGIDLFDVKYLHIFEPLITNSDEKQVIGRGTRLCGQKGLTFEPDIGWPLHVFKYNLNHKNNNIHDLFLKESGIDINKLLFSKELENISKYGAVDYDLNINIHNFGLKKSDNSTETNIYKKYKVNTDETFNISSKVKNPLVIKKSMGGGIKGNRKKGLNLNLVKAPKNIKKFLEMREYINTRFNKYTWDKIIFKNNCTNDFILKKNKAKSIGGAIKNLSQPLPNKALPPSLPAKDERLIKLTPTQEFVSNYFNNESGYKGLLLWHSVGTGKTCSAIATASKGFEEHGYTILWVTRHTLKSDIWKNMYSQVCSSVIRRKIINGENIPKNIKKDYLKYLSNGWMMPISYKQFSNMLAEKNNIYKLITKINGKNDPLRKTLVIIDEAHKLYSPDTSPSERPNLTIMNTKIKNSYKISGKDSVKLLLMTATPYTTDPMHLIKLINLMKEENDIIPEDFTDFTKKYLDNNGLFSDKGSENFLNDISGYISYLNREKDSRNFAYPVFYNINVNSSLMDKEITNIQTNIDSITENIKKLENELITAEKGKKKDIKEDIKKNKVNIKELKKKLKNLIEKDISQETAINKCFIKK